MNMEQPRVEKLELENLSLLFADGTNTKEDEFSNTFIIRMQFSLFFRCNDSIKLNHIHFHMESSFDKQLQYSRSFRSFESNLC